MDDKLGTYAKRFEAMGRSVRAHKPRVVWGLIKAGFTTACYDKQNYFDTDHPVIAANGNVQSVANTDGGSGAPWFLMDSRMLLKPVLFQVRKKPEFVYLDRSTDENVFMKKKHIYGVHSRDNVGFGFWQGIWGSKQTLNAANYASARAALINMTGDYGRPLGITPDVLIVTGTNESAARKIVINQNAAGGESNEWQGTARVVVSPWLAAA
jgi:phage major head subunit gpT-like protein